MSAEDQGDTTNMEGIQQSEQNEITEINEISELQAENTPGEAVPQVEAEKGEAEETDPAVQVNQDEADATANENSNTAENDQAVTETDQPPDSQENANGNAQEKDQVAPETADQQPDSQENANGNAQEKDQVAPETADQQPDSQENANSNVQENDQVAADLPPDSQENANGNAPENYQVVPETADQLPDSQENANDQDANNETQEVGGVSQTASRSGSPQALQSKPPTPTGSKPGTPIPGNLQTGSKQASPAGSRPGSATEKKPPSPTQATGSKPPSPTGSKQPSQAGSRAPSVTGSKLPSQAGSKPPTPAGSKPPSPTLSKQPSNARSKPSTPIGSKPPTPTGSKPATPVGSKKATLTGSKEGSRAGTPQESQQPTTSEQVEKAQSNTPSPSQQQLPDAAAIQQPGAEPSGQTSIGPEVPPPPPLKSDKQESSAQEIPVSNRALNIIWSFGLNKNVPILNLSDGNRTRVMYVCAHTGVLYDYKSNTQTLLQGHGNAISCTCVSEDKRWVATADQGDNSLIIIWDTQTGTPVRTLFEAHPEGTAAIAMTPDAKYLASLSSTMPQMLAIWDWTVEGEVPICTAELDPAYGLQNYIYFNPEDITQLVTNSESQVIFYSWEGDKLLWQAPPLADEDFNKQVGKFSQSIFLQESTRALTATSLGNLVVWDSNKQNNKKRHDRKALKLVKLQDKGLNVITVTEKYIVTGDLQGHVKFFDQTMKLVNWYQDLQVGPINAISFAHDAQFSSSYSQGKNYPSDATIHAAPLPTQDFVIGTTEAVYAHITTDGSDIEIIHRDHDAPVHALVAHPNRPYLVIGGHSGLLQVWDYEKRQTVVIRRFQHAQIACCNFDPEGQYLAVGFTNGSLRILDSLSLDDVIPDAFCYARDTITHVVFSHNSQYLATADAEYTVSLYKVCYDIEEDQWQYVGRYKSHYKYIQDILFTVHLDSNLPRLMSLGQDRVLVEYDLENSYKDNLKILSMDRIEQSAEPQCMAMYPPVTKESFIITANDQYKFKLYNATTKMCRKTLLSPTYGSPVKKIVVLPMTHDYRGHIAYITDNKVGMNILPLDGNPHNAMALVAHPQGVANLVSSFDGKYLFTAGGIDSTVHMWAINIDALRAQAQLGGKELIPFYGLLDGGRDGDLFKELEDYFYYAQIRSQGVNAHSERGTSETIPVSEIPFVMRAMGFYPSEQEVEDMLNEVKYSTYIDTGSYKTDIDLGDFIKLYVNHRPAFGLQPNKLAWAFDVLGFDTINGPAVDRGDLLNLLQTAGETMTEYELAEYLTTLMGYNEEGGQSEQQVFDPEEAGDIIDQNLPHDITAEMFANDLLGFDMYLDYLPSQSRSSSQVTAAI